MLPRSCFVIFGTPESMQSALFTENRTLRTIPYFSGIYHGRNKKLGKVIFGFADGFEQVSL